MKNISCDFCKKDFSSKGNLKLHQKSAKYCLNIRNKEIVNEYKCEFCEDIFIRKSILVNHYDICKKKKDIEINNKLEKIKNNYEQKIKLLQIEFDEKLKKNESIYQEQLKKAELQITNLQNQIKELAQTAIEKPTVVNNSSSNNSNNKMIDNRTFNMIPFSLDEENLKRTLEQKFTENHLINGQKGVAQFCIEHILVSEDNKYMLKCTDPSRKIFVYVDQEGRIHKDINAFKLTRIISEPVIDASYKMINELPDKYPDDMDRVDFATNKFVEITNIKVDNNEFVKNLIPSLIKT
jgi:hypothetical protein